MKIMHEQINRNPILRQYENSKSTKDMQVTIDPVAAEAIEVAKQNEEIARKALENNLKTAEELIAYNEKEGPKKPEVEKLTLSESLFEAVKHNDTVGYIVDSLNNIRDAIDADGMIPTRKAFKSAFKQFLHVADLDEDLSGTEYDELKSDVYNALADICFDYSDDGISLHDIELAIDWFLTHFFDSDDSVFLTESTKDLSLIEGSMTNTLLKYTNELSKVLTKEELIKTVEDALDRDNIKRTKGVQKLVDDLKNAKTLLQAQFRLYNSILAGQDEAVITEAKDFNFSYEDYFTDEESIAELVKDMKKEEINPWSKLDLDKAEVKEYLEDEFFDKKTAKEMRKCVEKYCAEHVEPLTVFEAVFNDLASRTDFLRHIAPKKAHGRSYDQINSIRADDEGIIILATSDKNLDRARFVADFYRLNTKGPIFRKEHAARLKSMLPTRDTEHENDNLNYWFKILIPESIQNLDADEYLASI